jgi:coenzyme Q-binding protein COQ10
MFALVADVSRYPEFVPYWHAVRVRDRRDDGYRTDQVVRLGPMRHTFSTDTRLLPPAEIVVTSGDPPFRHLSLQWKFHRAEDGGCRISLRAEFELKSLTLRALGALLSTESINRMITAFEERARAVYGPPDAASHA